MPVGIVLAVLSVLHRVPAAALAADDDPIRAAWDAGGRFPGRFEPTYSAGVVDLPRWNPVRLRKLDTDMLWFMTLPFTASTDSELLHVAQSAQVQIIALWYGRGNPSQHTAGALYTGVWWPSWGRGVLFEARFPELVTLASFFTLDAAAVEGAGFKAIGPLLLSQPWLLEQPRWMLDTVPALLAASGVQVPPSRLLIARHTPVSTSQLLTLPLQHERLDLWASPVALVPNSSGVAVAVSAGLSQSASAAGAETEPDTGKTRAFSVAPLSIYELAHLHLWLLAGGVLGEAVWMLLYVNWLWRRTALVHIPFPLFVIASVSELALAMSSFSYLLRAPSPSNVVLVVFTLFARVVIENACGRELGMRLAQSAPSGRAIRCYVPVPVLLNCVAIALTILFPSMFVTPTSWIALGGFAISYAPWGIQGVYSVYKNVRPGRGMPARYRWALTALRLAPPLALSAVLGILGLDYEFPVFLAVVVVAAFAVAGLVMLDIQDIFGPRIRPSAESCPEYHDYHRPIAPDELIFGMEDGSAMDSTEGGSADTPVHRAEAGAHAPARDDLGGPHAPPRTGLFARLTGQLGLRPSTQPRGAAGPAPGAEDIELSDDEATDAQPTARRRLPDCPVCFEPIPFDAAQYMISPCRHIFHTHCLCQWLDVSLQCPVCRADLPLPQGM